MSHPPAGTTRVAAVIGDPVRHSLSPAIHNAAFAAAGLDWVFVAFPVAAGRAAAAVDAVRALDLGGLSVTMPHKHEVARHVDRLTPDAAALGAVNCVARDGDVLVGHNTDGDGFVDALRADAGVDPAGRRAVVLGAGGAARAVVLALARGGAEVVVVNRSPEPAERAVALAGGRGRVGAPADVAAADVVINATPVGMEGAPPGPPTGAEHLRSGQVVVDLVYHPRRTPLLERAAAEGAIAVGGLGMLVHQAGRAFTLWTGEPAPIDVMTAAVGGSVDEKC